MATHTSINKEINTIEKQALKWKVCGMKLNTAEVATLYPDYLGFIFWEPSKRYFEGLIPELPHTIKKVGVFVDDSITFIIEKVHKYNLVAVQLHGEESPEFCKKLKNEIPTIEIIKVFSIKNEFNFDSLKPYEKLVDFFLFDTKGKLPGGNGYIFDWKVLKDYPSTKPYFLSGGIGLEEIEKLSSFLQLPTAKYCYAIDVNSKFELAPGLKDIDKLRKLKIVLSTRY